MGIKIGSVSTESIKRQMLKKGEKLDPPIPANRLLSTGSTLLNLACSGRTVGGFAKGKYYFLVGDSTSGKTFLALTCFAEATRNKNFADHRLIFDNAEDGALMDFERFFGPEVARRVEPPGRDKEGNPVYSETVEQFDFFLDDAKKEARKGRPFIYVLDSMDAIESDPEIKKFEAAKTAYKTGKKAPGDYGMQKAKANSQLMRRCIKAVRPDSIVIVISQTRDNVAPAGTPPHLLKFQEKKTRGGGRALKFYATLEMWSSVAGTVKKTVRERNMKVGVISQVQVKKNRITGNDRTVKIPILNSYGMDDIGSCIDYLLEWNHWKKGKGGINAEEFDFKGNREKVIRHIESIDGERELRKIVGRVWNEVEEELKSKRKAKYQ